MSKMSEVCSVIIILAFLVIVALLMVKYDSEGACACHDCPEEDRYVYRAYYLNETVENVVEEEWDRGKALDSANSMEARK